MALTTNEKKEAAYALLGKLDDVNQMNTALQAGTAVTALKAIDLSSVTPTAAQLNDAKAEYDAIRSQPATTYGGATIPAMANTALWNEIKAEAEA